MRDGSALRACRICGGDRIAPVLDLGAQPWCNHFLRENERGTEPYYPLRLAYCHDCSAAQLDYTVPKEVMFGDHTYLSGVTQTLSQHFKQVAEDVDRRWLSMRTGKSALDIGSNDGTQLRHFRDLGYDVLGIEPARTPAAIARRAGITTINDYFDQRLSASLGRR